MNVLELCRLVELKDHEALQARHNFEKAVRSKDKINQHPLTVEHMLNYLSKCEEELEQLNYALDLAMSGDCHIVEIFAN